MACFNPTFAWKTHAIHPKTGKPVYSTKPTDAINTLDPVTWPCGKCIGCHARRAQEWGIRGMHEAQMHEENSFLTLTYNPHHLPSDGNLNPDHLRDFIKRMRERIEPTKVKYLACGEYGPHGGRPHYHTCIYGYQFPDLEQSGVSPKGKAIYRSKLLKQLWPFGRHTVQDANYQTACYVAKYTHKYNMQNRAKLKIPDDKVEEFSRQSNGLGLDFFNRFTSDMYPCDEVCIKGDNGIYKVKPPRYYDKKYEELHPEQFARIKRKRVQKAYKNRGDNTPARLAVKEEIRLLRLKDLPRIID